MTQELQPLQPLKPEVFATLPQEVQIYIRALESQIVLLVTHIQALTVEVEQLKARLAKDSSNSSKPPSSDGLSKKPKTHSLREQSGKQPGGQPGRIGKTLEQRSYPDYIEVHTPISCKNCQKNLIDIEASAIERRQVFDLPKIAVVVTEHRAEIKICPCCGHKTKGEFPDHVRGIVQYGEQIQALVAYFEHQHLIPFARISQIFEDVYGVALSPGTCSNMDKRLFNNLEVFEKGLKVYLLACKVLHFDETGVRCEKKLSWIHVTSSTSATFYGLHKKRGKQAIDDHNILPQFNGIAVHDHWQPYFSYGQAEHMLCNVHHLRELKYVYEQEKAEWAEEMSKLLLKAKKFADNARGQGRESVSHQERAIVEKEYRELILKAANTYLDLSASSVTCGKAGFNIFKRLLHEMGSVLGFLYDVTVPFSNNLAEQDLRMEKVKQKISGCFRTFTGGCISCRVRGYISTARKQGWRIIDALAEAIRGSPRLLSFPDL